MKYRVDGLDNEEFEVLDAQVQEDRDDRRFILRVVAVAVVSLVLAAAGYDVYADGAGVEFKTVSALWEHAQPLVWIIVGFYFGKNDQKRS